ncbi:MAG TPA: glycosyl hydrolase family 18 protein [Thermoanaerobaculia bacterium]|jgi:chitodextrinase
MRAAFASVVLLFFLPLQEARGARPAASGFEVAVYADVDTPAGSIPYDRIDGLVLAFLNPVDGCRGYSEVAFPAVQEIVRSARQQEANGRRITVTFAIGGGGNATANQRLESIASSEDCRQQFAGQVAAILATNGLDGVDVDWEFPQPASLGNYTLFIKALREAIGSRLLSIAVYDDSGKEDASDRLTPDVLPFVDYFMVMAYLGDRNSAIDGWTNPPWNLPESKLRLGLAFFGIPDDGGPAVAYRQLLGSVPATQATPCGDRVGMYALNGMRTTGELTRFAMTEKLGGITAWQLGQDRTDSISLLLAATETARMWDDFDEWQPNTSYPAGTVVQHEGNLWLAQSSAAPATAEPGASRSAFKQLEVVEEWSAHDYYCGGDEIWFAGAVYRAVQDPVLSVDDLSPTASPSLWKKLYTAPAYDGSRTYKKGDRVFFNGSAYTARKTARGQSPATAAASWSPFVTADAFDAGKTYAAGATIRYMGNTYLSKKRSVGQNPVVATDVWQPVTK